MPFQSEWRCNKGKKYDFHPSIKSKFQKQYHHYNPDPMDNDATECLLQLFDYNCNCKYDENTLKYNMHDSL